MNPDTKSCPVKLLSIAATHYFYGARGLLKSRCDLKLMTAYSVELNCRSCHAAVHTAATKQVVFFKECKFDV